MLGLVGTGLSGARRGLIGWFGVRGVGSLYYLAYAISHGVPPELARDLADVVLVTVAVSIVVHGVSVTPLMDWYGTRGGRAASAPGREAALAGDEDGPGHPPMER
jgi:sodium/hydrogen antiporter